MKSNHNYSSRFRILKGGKISLVVSALLGSVTLSFAAPSGGVVTSGSATISQNGNTTNITQSTQKASINWNKFNIASNETVNFNQPNVNSITLNRVIGNERSIIDGALNANGQVWILNSNGVLFGKNASINTAGLLASTKNITDTNFQAGNYTFTGDSTESVINEGSIKIKDNGYVILASNEVRNSGTIEAVKGRVQLTSADEYTINLNGNSLVDLVVNKGTLDALVENSGTILSDGGEVYLTTHAVDELLRGVVNNTGIIEANSLDGISGHVELYAHGGTANIAGTIKAKGGFVETSGKELNVSSTTSIETSKWLLDPVNMTIESTGGTDLSGGSVSATAIQSALSSADVELQADEDITVNENITWGDATKLTLTAGDEIYVNATIENTNSTNGGVYFNAANNYDKVIFNSNGKVIINNINQLQWMNTALKGKYELGSNIDASDTRNWNSDGSGGYYGFKQIGFSSQFFGNFDGKGYVIDGLYINRGSENEVGLFSYGVGGSIISNVGLTNVDITGKDYVGGLVGNNNPTIRNSYVTGSVSGNRYVGGLVGYFSGTITNSYTAVTVNGNDSVGGLVGYLDGISGGNITNSYATGAVSGNTDTGGLVGGIFDTGYSISNSYWDIDTTGQASSSGGGTGLTTVQIQQQANFTGFDFTNTWIIYEGHTRPLLRTFMTELTVKANDATRTYDGTTYSGSGGVTYSIPTYDSSLLQGSLNYTSSDDLKNAGTATIGVDGLYSSQHGYIISYDTGTLITNKKDITANYTAENKIYDGTTDAIVNGTLAGIISGDTVTVSNTSANFTDKNAGENKTVNIAGISISGTDSSNYSISNTSSATADITKRALSLEATKDYDGTDDLTGFVKFGNLVGSETLEYIGAKANSSNPTAENFIKEITLQDGTNGGLASNYELPSLLAYSANNSVQIGDIPIEPTTTPDLNSIISSITNKTVLTNKDIDTLFKSGIDIKTIFQQLNTNELALIPGVVLQMLNGGINLPFGSKQQFNFNDENDEENRI
ncbi:filamentous hemagglutinin [Arcobacter sp. CECT 8983]|uniref:two-partner secretion domain-containing protein n=1 Tax=Arcobacter sp. CECT 8983 TaxID=2044508 RepID=UPI00100A8B83|nr:filamentous hemagglutinin N-terminal domain-containing protein [Arcobacter sp. CECT 8983]RXJ88834.1 filamentous hemagglutinin [Arcobacter sp. CECT 8983]